MQPPRCDRQVGLEHYIDERRGFIAFGRKRKNPDFFCLQDSRDQHLDLSDRRGAWRPWLAQSRCHRPETIYRAGSFVWRLRSIARCRRSTSFFTSAEILCLVR